MTNLKRVPLFDEMGDDSPEKQELINGNSVGIANLNENKFTWSSKLYRVMVGNFWIPHKVSLVDDQVSINELTIDEDNAVKNTLSFLIFLDSFQCNNLPNISQYITAPNVANLIKIQEYQEVIHSESYQYIMEALYPLTVRESIYNKWRDNPVLLDRIKFVVSIADEFNTNPNIKNVIIVFGSEDKIFAHRGISKFRWEFCTHNTVHKFVMNHSICNKISYGNYFNIKLLSKLLKLWQLCHTTIIIHYFTKHT